MTEIQTHIYEDEEVRTLLVDEQPCFIANDLCEVLGLANPRTSLALLDEDEKGVHTMDTLGGDQQMAYVTEAGMYSLVLRSRKPEAKVFKRWLTHEVLPEIRRTGMYAVKPKTLEERALEIVGELQSVVANQAQELEAARPKVAQIDMYRQAEGLQTISDLANQLQVWAQSNAPAAKVRHQDVFDLAGELHIIIRGETVRRNQATAQAVKADWVKVKESIIGSGDRERVVFSVRLTHRGAGRLWDAAIARLSAGEPIYRKKAS